MQASWIAEQKNQTLDEILKQQLLLPKASTPCCQHAGTNACPASHMSPDPPDKHNGLVVKSNNFKFFTPGIVIPAGQNPYVI